MQKKWPTKEMARKEKVAKRKTGATKKKGKGRVRHENRKGK